MKNSDNPTGIIVVILVIISLGGYFLYDYMKSKNKSIDTPNPNSVTSSSGTVKIIPDNGVNSTAAKAYTNVMGSDSIPPINELVNPNPNDVVTLNPHWKGKWKSGSNDMIIERYSSKSYKKDKPLEIFSANKKWKMYHVKYYGDMCYFPVDLISEEGAWK